VVRVAWPATKLFGSPSSETTFFLALNSSSDINVFGDMTDCELAEVYNYAVDPQHRPVLDDDATTLLHKTFARQA